MWDPSDGHCYAKDHNLRTFSDASDNCAQMGMRLAEFDSSEQYTSSIRSRLGGVCAKTWKEDTIGQGGFNVLLGRLNRNKCASGCFAMGANAVEVQPEQGELVKCFCRIGRTGEQSLSGWEAAWLKPCHDDSGKDVVKFLYLSLKPHVNDSFLVVDGCVQAWTLGKGSGQKEEDLGLLSTQDCLTQCIQR